MNDLQTKQKAFLNETASFYNSNNLCTVGKSCYYFAPDKPGCAIGRHINDKELCKYLDKTLARSSGVKINSVFEQIPQNLKELGQEFLVEIQNLHDSKWNWNDHGLSFIGSEQIEMIKKQFGLY